MMAPLSHNGTRMPIAAPAIRRVLVIGGGIAGMTAATCLRRQGLEVDLVEIDPAWKVYGAGITITSPTLRALHRLGVLDEVKRRGATWDDGVLLTPDGRELGAVRWPSFAAGEPSSGGIMRSELHGILSRMTREAGVHVRLGVTTDAMEDGAEGVDVRFTDGSVGHYQLVVAADGVASAVRGRLFPDVAGPAYTGQAVYRIVVATPPGVSCGRFIPNGDRMIGCSLVSATHMYCFVLIPMPGDPRVAVADQPAHLHRAMEGFGDFVPGVRAQVLNSPVRETINYRPLAAMILPKPWYRGHVVLVGDAAHATTPHLASGAGMAIESGLVLAEEVARGGTVGEILQRYTDRRYDRCRTVVENSVRLGQMELRGESPLEHNRVADATIAELVSEP